MKAAPFFFSIQTQQFSPNPTAPLFTSSSSSSSNQFISDVLPISAAGADNIDSVARICRSSASAAARFISPAADSVAAISSITSSAFPRVAWSIRGEKRFELHRAPQHPVLELFVNPSFSHASWFLEEIACCHSHPGG